MNRFTTTAALLSVASAVLAAEGNFKLKQAPGVARVQANCVACHSLDGHIELNSKISRPQGLGSGGYEDDEGIRRAR